ncbi:hypothetical protein TIFTF001_013301 [Ficus carica]|uniref:Secreted protein n=1 Tax=Ficus carica TaxID=3494 RepID=A0AA87ZUP7_FICCA|nr:hypothetical protein TIFTF001_013301 [Ficus carica]
MSMISLAITVLVFQLQLPAYMSLAIYLAAPELTTGLPESARPVVVVFRSRSRCQCHLVQLRGGGHHQNRVAQQFEA